MHLLSVVIAALMVPAASAAAAMAVQQPRLAFQEASAEAQALPAASKLARQGSTSDCGSTGDVLTLEQFELQPDPPQRGGVLVVTGRGQLSEDVVLGSTAQVKVKLGFIQILDQQFDLCDKVTNVDLECPLLAGPVAFSKGFDIPGSLPPGKYTVNVDVTNANGHHIGCLHAEFRM
eukprot:jgi/Hompol1/1203/HPOL_005536-RA